MYVYYTVDTELWPRNPLNPNFEEAADDYQRDVFGVTREGEFGIRYQMDGLEAEGLKGVFFIETLHALKLGASYLHEMVDVVQKRGHEAALHIHPEWLEWLEEHPLGGKNSPFMKEYSAYHQRWMIQCGLRLLRESGVRRVASFRAGNYGANRDTLRGLADGEITFDTSYNVAFVGEACGINVEAPLTNPRKVEGVVEVPIAFIQDYPGHYRPMQVVAASFAEMRAALDQAERRGFQSFVIVSHGFELIRRRTQCPSGAQVDRTVLRRFDELMKYLGRNKDRYQVITFADTVPDRLFSLVADESPVKGSVLKTIGRMFEQFLRRVVAKG